MQDMYQRRDRLIQEHRHDTYRQRKKLPEPTQCPECRAVFVKGRWTWETPEVEPRAATCPACLRIADKYPAGFLNLSGSFLQDHREEILNLMRNVEKLEKNEHPLERIMDIEDVEDGLLVTTTGVHIAHRLGKSLAHAYEGDLDYNYDEVERLIRLTWKREAA